MHANRVQQGTTTTGTGTISLNGSTPSGRIAFSTFFSSGQYVEYTIEDGNDWECGQGLLTSGSPWTLSRAIIYEKCVSGTLTQKPATGLTLSGSATVSVYPLAQDIITQPPNIMSSIQPYVAPANYTSTSTAALVADRLYKFPFLVPKSGWYDAFAIYVWTPVTGKVRCALYRIDTSGEAASTIQESGDMATNSPGGMVTSTFTAKYLQAGYYWGGLLGNAAPTLVGYDKAITGGPLQTDNGLFLLTNATQSVSSGWTSMPAPPSTGGSSQYGVFPGFCLRKA